MTCVAYRDLILAADTLSCSKYGSNPVFISKIFCFKGALYGCSGDVTEATVFRDWIENDCAPPAPVIAESMDILRISPAGKISWSTGKHARFTEIDAPYLAIGSGADHAMGAMWKGADAVEAVECAKQLNRWCGGDTQVLLTRSGSDLKGFSWGEKARRFHTGGPFVIPYSPMVTAR